jgi:hypothetical protein
MRLQLVLLQEVVNYKAPEGAIAGPVQKFKASLCRSMQGFYYHVSIPFALNEVLQLFISDNTINLKHF